LLAHDRQRGNYSVAVLRTPKPGKVQAAQLAVENNANARSSEAKLRVRPGVAFQNKGIAKQAVDVRRLDIGPARCRPALAPVAPIFEQGPGGSVFHIIPAFLFFMAPFSPWHSGCTAMAQRGAIHRGAIYRLQGPCQMGPAPMAP
jgi:hypothetical protein